MKLITNRFFEGERALYAAKDMRLEDVKFYPGESALKESSNIEARACEFMGKYPLWHNDGALLERCIFTVYSRAAIWYSRDVRMLDSIVEAPKMFREARHLRLENTKMPNAAECFWTCQDVELRNVEIKGGDYIFMNSSDIRIQHFKLQGNYSFQSAKNVVIRHAHLDSKDAFWNTENVTVYDSVLDGEYLGWHSKNLRLVNCTIYGAQPLCYATDLVLENCSLVDTDLCFEHSSVRADIKGDILSIKNPASGYIKARSIGDIIIDEHCRNPGACEILVDEMADA